MKGYFNISDYRGFLLIEVAVEKFDFFMISENSGPLRLLLAERHYPSCIIDCLKVKLIDSSVFGFLLEAGNTIKKIGNDIVIVCDDPEVLHVMNMLRLPQMIRVFATREKAVDYLNSLKDM